MYFEPTYLTLKKGGWRRHIDIPNPRGWSVNQISTHRWQRMEFQLARTSEEPWTGGSVP